MGIFTASDKVKFKILKEDACEATFSVEIPAALADAENHNALLRLQQRAKLPGFRPGKAPLELVRRQFGAHLSDEVLDHFAHKHVPEALRELKLSPVATPVITDISLEAGKPLRFQVRVEVPPRVAPKDYSSLKLTRKSYPATDKAVQARLEELREAHARLERAVEQTVAKNHYVVIDYGAWRGGKALPNAKGSNELVDMSSEQTVAGLSDGLLGLKRGESKEITVKLGGQDAQMKVTVVEIKTKVIPALDKEFAKDMGFETLEELQAKLKEVVAAEGQNRGERELSEQLEAELLKSNRIPVPPSLVAAQLEHMLARLQRQLLGDRGEFSSKQIEDLKAKLRPQAEDQVRISFLLPAIAEREKLAVADAEFQAELEKSVAAAQTDDKKESVRRMFSERREEVMGMIRDRKTLAFLRDKAAITEVPGDDKP
ncbi:MAG TPA: trigger factor [Elusimicrobia bacterium]|nr:trigger factor [Elusimicrobiota bacterium]HBT61759.1 trigger factor [Elusimicrobiota bacterium]